MRGVIAIFVLVVLIIVLNQMSITGHAVNTTINLSKCYDTDGGKNYSVFGQACLEGGCTLDSCLATGLNEAYCEDNFIYTERYTCPLACENGRCINNSEERVIIACNDTDGKDNYEVTGYIRVLYNDNSSERVNDRCEWMNVENQYFARDYFCEEIANSTYDYSYSTKACGKSCDNCSEEQKELNEAINETTEIENTATEKILIREKELGEYCRSNYACKSNLCINNECSTKNILLNIINWLKNLFGM